MAWIGALIGVAGSAMMDSGGSSQSQTNSVSPEFSPLAGSVANRGMQFGDMPYQPYPYSRVSDFSPYQFTGFDQIADRATEDWGVPQQAEQALGGMLSMGGPKNPYAGANPFLEENIQNTLGDITKQFNTSVAPSMAATALRGGSFGNSGAAEMEQQARDSLAQTLGRTSGNMRMQDYGMQQQLAESGLNRGQSGMLQSLGMAPSIYGLGYAPGRELLGIGGTMQQQGQNVLNDSYSQFQDSQSWPFKTYDAMMAPFGRGVAGSQSTTTGPTGNPAAGLMGGAMLGNQIYRQYQQPTSSYGQFAPQGNSGVPTDFNSYSQYGYMGGP